MALHLALQQRLIDTTPTLFSNNTQADGLYDEGTRQAIKI